MAEAPRFPSALGFMLQLRGPSGDSETRKRGLGWFVVAAMAGAQTMSTYLRASQRSALQGMRRSPVLTRCHSSRTAQVNRLKDFRPKLVPTTR